MSEQHKGETGLVLELTEPAGLLWAADPARGVPDKLTWQVSGVLSHRAWAPPTFGDYYHVLLVGPFTWVGAGGRFLEGDSVWLEDCEEAGGVLSQPPPSRGVDAALC